MTLTELIAHLTEMKEQAEAAGMDPSEMEVKVYGERGVPRHVTAQRIIKSGTVTIKHEYE